MRVFTAGAGTVEDGDKMFISGTQGLETGAGYHRLEWDLRTYGASAGTGRRGGRGPLVPPEGTG
ncbi:MAG: hypothetical protein R2744_12590 [Bacteroidales bacterium]